ncbi:hypothetical protein OX90_09005 [Pseudomonas coronafaciens pv. porri]|uniref:Phosphoglycerate mutase protein n=1 Tax=Pseudomonas coronafaciens pv. porri TaxID=83964 RepID=A0ABR5JQV0_9PSED|nr:hypothetical protein [Pseudomonas coronafaciens]KOP56756.1 hypothetical protein OX88_08380 [Pseudomonas coronafaciens pv. porri]KOP59884.1 hypothetical protein OX90_09005 [Pseudomonas coronafaciens pv. porri]RMU86959.1 Phosphoglycerate mutase protein [Pseudomonas coronafaciens pv. porri]RMW02521.1 Phosphoglycerate mutase protein [Pseudomonas coronafaciens pv. porri]RMW07457.1 Phosphoglycerate mutase protein [Pseudomonas coronafaciens pv. porri]
MSKLVRLIRNAESAANEEVATEYPDSIPLTAKGFSQAQKLAAAITLDPDLIIPLLFQPYETVSGMCRPS